MYSYVATYSLLHVVFYVETLGIFNGLCSLCTLYQSVLLVGSNGVDKERLIHCSLSHCAS